MASESADDSGREKLPRYVEHDGYFVAGGFPVEGLRSGLKYKAQADDLFIVTYPKVSNDVRRGARCPMPEVTCPRLHTVFCFVRGSSKRASGIVCNDD